jgi:La domain
MMDSTKISAQLDDARECCEQPDTMIEKAVSSTQEQQPPQSSPESTMNGVVATSTVTTPSATTTAPSSTSPVVTSEDSGNMRPEEDGKQKCQQQASQEAVTDATKGEAASAVTSHDALVLTQLARQLEYYFSRQNLAKDTYVQTLRQLNSGCVPVAILANFSKVKLLLSSSTTSEEGARVKAVLQACTEHSAGRLRVVAIDTGSGKIVSDQESTASTILAIGTHDNEPLTISVDAMSMMATSPTTTTSKSVVFLPSSPMGGSVGATNTLILRDVIPQVTEQEIQALFTFEGCPSVESIHQDVGNCW